MHCSIKILILMLRKVEEEEENVVGLAAQYVAVYCSVQAEIVRDYV